MSRTFRPGDIVRTTREVNRPTPEVSTYEVLPIGSEGRVVGSASSTGKLPVLVGSDQMPWFLAPTHLELIEVTNVGAGAGAAIQQTLAERSRYGEFKHNAMLAQTLKADLRAFPNWEKLAPHQRQALDIIMDKVSRIVCGDPNYRDNWHDIQGYAQLVEERLPDPGEAPKAAPWG